MKNKLLIIGASGHGKVVADIAIKMDKWQEIAFLDDDTLIDKSMGLNVIGTSKDIAQYIDTYEVIVGIGDNSIREEMHKKLELLGASIPVLIHPQSVIGEKVRIGIGTVVMAGVVINCCSNIGKGCIVNTSATVDHDNSIEDFVHVSPGAHLAGTVKIGKGSWLGIGSVVSNNINIIDNCQVGAGAVVVNDLKEVGIYKGIPAKKSN